MEIVKEAVFSYKGKEFVFEEFIDFPEKNQKEFVNDGGTWLARDKINEQTQEPLKQQKFASGYDEGVNITHASRNAAADAKIFELNVQLEAIEIIIKKENEKQKIIEKKMDPIVLQIPNNKISKTDYTRPITIGIILLAIIGGVLIWKLK